ncbi:hydrogen peroxide-inducible genes activator [Reinekea sp.]|jgi:LysR family hydrogen peroxide-inducible transcriptional activator|uniref:hydrogen peroxide-inducible genes activator n=1 Tax=Reinekea sp. TaxID=1970455 RepID=UPI002A82E3F3|nr:hydrogen peroxide-inducible genes activator [Reinekea sp.]
MAVHYPSFKQLHYLVALVRTGHFGQAAEQCFVTQSTMSTSIAELEHLLGVQLVERINKRNIIITAEAKRLAADAEQLLALADRWIASPGSSHRPIAALKVGLIPTIAPFLLPRLLPAVHRQSPTLRLENSEKSSSELVQAVESGALDVGILALPFDTGKLQVVALFADRFYVALPRGHALAAVPSLTASDLAKYKLLMLEKSHCLSGHTLALCQLSSDNEVAGSNLYTLMQLVANNQGIAVVPELAVAALSALDNGLVFIEFREPGRHREVALVMRASWAEQDRARRLVTLIRALSTGPKGSAS